MRRRHLQQGKGALELIEETVHLLRLAPASVLFTYYLGTLPFVLGLLYFWSDMSRSSFADQRLPAAALGVTLLFLWMKCWQSVFTRQLLARLCGESAPRLSGRRWLRIALLQTIVQPSGLLLLPPAAVMLAPFGWVYGFYQSATVLGSGENSDVRQLLRRAARQASLWPGQNNYALLTLKVFGFFVFLNLLSGALTLPFLIKLIFGVETTFTRSTAAVLNPTFFAVLVGLTHLCLDPLVKAFYTLRCFHGESLRTGQDLRTELRGLASVNKLAAAVVVALALGTAVAPRVPAADPSPAPSKTAKLETQNSVSPPTLDRAISEVISQREYNWRLPRVKSADKEKEKGTLATLVENFFETLRDWFRQVDRWLTKFYKWLQGERRSSASDGFDLSRLGNLHWLLVVLVIALACVVGVMAVRMWRRRRHQEEVMAQPAQSLPDVADENVGADQLPEDGWIKMARELLERGELRLALRAFYLSSLAHLAERNLIALAKFKSNRDYERELDRRSHALPALTVTFSENVGMFDRVWYGLHEVTREMLDQFAGNVERIKGST